MKKFHTGAGEDAQHFVPPGLQKLLERHQSALFKKPIAAHTQQAFAQAENMIAERAQALILDSGCGVGESTVALARLFPGNFVLGIDKSLARLSKHHAYQKAGVQNYALLRANLVDLWRLAVARNWQVERHYILYPNPWPTPKGLQKRWHGHPVFPQLLRLGKFIELRSNSRAYLEEFAFAVWWSTGKKFEVISHCPEPVLTPFERKYQARGQQLFRLALVLAGE